jgi:hypothetical protein
MPDLVAERQRYSARKAPCRQGRQDQQHELYQLVENCRDHGLHPATSLVGAVFANNVSRHNEACVKDIW